MRVTGVDSLGMRPIKKMAAVMAVTVCVAVGVSGLGVAASALSAKDFRKTANDICRQGHMLREQLAEDHFGTLPEGQEPTSAELQGFVEEYRSLVQQQIDALRALPRPANVKAKLTKMLSAAKAALARVVADPTILTGDSDPFVAVRARARDLGLAQCAA